jgi:hypothetical protein
MNNFGKLVVKMGLLSLLSVMPLAAQIDYGVVFTAPFPFYAGNVKLPAGSYKLTELSGNAQTVLLQNSANDDAVFLSFIPTGTVDPSEESDVTFDKIGDTGYLRAVAVEGETAGIKFGRSEAEIKAAMTETRAEITNVVEHATPAHGE